MPRTTAFQVNTENKATITEAQRKELFTENIAGLFKCEQPVEILGNKLRYYKPGIIQSGYLMRALVAPVSESLYSQEEINKRDRFTLWTEASEWLTNISTDETELSALFVKIMTHPESVECLYQAIKDCFPDIAHPERLTDEAFMTIFNQLFEDTVFNTDNA